MSIYAGSPEARTIGRVKSPMESDVESPTMGAHGYAAFALMTGLLGMMKARGAVPPEDMMSIIDHALLTLEAFAERNPPEGDRQAIREARELVEVALKEARQ